MVEEVIELAHRLNASSSHVKSSANSEADKLAKEGVSHSNLLIHHSYFSVWSFFWAFPLFA